MENSGLHIFEHLHKTQIFYAIQQIDNLYVGVKNAIGIGYSEAHENYFVMIRDDEAKQHPELVAKPITLDKGLKTLRQKRQSFTWVYPEDIPYKISQNEGEIRSATIFNEKERNVLLLRFPNAADNQSDLLYLQVVPSFSKASSNERTVLSPEFKNVAGNLIANALQTLISQHSSFKERLLKQFDYGQHVVSNLKREVEDNAVQTEVFQKRVLEFSQYIIEHLGDRLNVRFHLSEQAKEKIQTFNQPLHLLEPILDEATACALGFNVPNIKGREALVIIEPYHITINAFSQPKTESVKTVEEATTRYANTAALLDRYENAARKVISNSQKLTSENVGNACPKPITAPAITDALKKHKSKIVHLFDQYPDKWRILRTEFRPIQNMLNY